MSKIYLATEDWVKSYVNENGGSSQSSAYNTIKNCTWSDTVTVGTTEITFDDTNMKITVTHKNTSGGSNSSAYTMGKYFTLHLQDYYLYNRLTFHIEHSGGVSPYAIYIKDANNNTAMTINDTVSGDVNIPLLFLGSKVEIRIQIVVAPSATGTWTLSNLLFTS